MIIRGFIDESYDSKIFLLSALVGVGSEWRWLSRDWLACIDKWNVRLRAHGRKPIKRFHASELNSLDNEFEGWSKDEQIEFMGNLIKVLGRSKLHSFALALDMEDLHKVFPDASRTAKPDLPGWIYGFMITFMVFLLAPEFFAADPTLRITLVHDRCKYDGLIADAFRKAIEDPGFPEGKCYTSITPGSSFDLPPLQMADLLSHENFKEVKRKYKSGKKQMPKQRTSLKVLIKQGNIGGGVRYISLAALRALAQHIEKHRAEFAESTRSS